MVKNYVLRPSGTKAIPDALSPGLHHLCLRVDTPADVAAVAAQLREAGIAASDAKRYPIYAPNYWATCFTDPDGIRWREKVCHDEPKLVRW